jgi:hypothetical protein
MSTKIRNNKKKITRTEPNANDAVRVAKNYLKRMLNPKSILLEEIDKTSDGKYWLITLSHEKLAKDKRQRSLNHLLTIPLNRSYKVIKINKKTGMVESMKIREI